MMNITDIVLLMEEASKRLEKRDTIFTDKSETVLAILRSQGVISSKRLQQNGKYHTILAASLVLAHEKNSDLYLTTRSQVNCLAEASAPHCLSSLMLQSSKG